MQAKIAVWASLWLLDIIGYLNASGQTRHAKKKEKQTDQSLQSSFGICNKPISYKVFICHTVDVG